jgi:hypothetical protein
MSEPQELDEFNPNNPYTAIALLGERIKGIVEREKAIAKREDDLEARIAKMEKSYQRGAGILIGLSALGGSAGLLAANWKTIFKPWAG